jgi:CHAD domain-containing protein
MPFHFKRTESPARGVRRVCRERIGVALEHLRKGDRPAVVHSVRKEIKKLRALFRLVRGEIGRGDYQKSTKALRKAADCLAAARDARVMFRAFEKLAGRPASRRFPEVRKVLLQNCHHESRRFRSRHSVALAGGILKKTGRRVRGLKIKTPGWAVIEPGLRQSYRRGQEACRLIHQEPSPEHFHEWRKRVKDLWYYFCLLSPAWPPPLRAWTDDLELLGGLLGDDHDLFMLQQFIAETRTGQGREAAALSRLIVMRQRKLRAAALKLGSRIYAETPAVLCRRLEQCWDDWRAGK